MLGRRLVLDFGIGRRAAELLRALSEGDRGEQAAGGGYNGE